jgi:hypothetical protein
VRASAADAQGDVASLPEDAAFYACFPDATMELEIAICDETHISDGTEMPVLHIIAAQAVPAGAEVHNTYGEHSNDALLCKYGFALHSNVFHGVRVGSECYKAAAAATGTKLALPDLQSRVSELSELLQHGERSEDACQSQSVSEHSGSPGLDSAPADHQAASIEHEESGSDGCQELETQCEPDDGSEVDEHPPELDARIFGHGYVSGELVCELVAVGATAEEWTRVQHTGLLQHLQSMLRGCQPPLSIGVHTVDSLSAPDTSCHADVLLLHA